MLRTLYAYELKKIFRNRFTILALLFGVAILFGTPAIGFAVDQYHSHVKEQEVILEGRPLDDTMLAELGQRIKDNDSEISVAENDPYRYLAFFVANAAGIHMGRVDVPEVSMTELTADSFYGQRAAILSIMFDYFKLTDEERAWWDTQESKIEKPFLYQSYQGSHYFWDNMLATPMFLFLVISVSLSGVFAGEVSHRTDALIYASKYGKRRLFAAKLMAGETFTLFAAALFLLAVQGPNLVRNGLTGLSAPWQFIVPFSSVPATIGTMLIAYIVVYFLSALLVGALVLCLSALLKNSVASTGIVFALTIFDLFSAFSPEYRILSQLRYLSPLQILNNSSIDDPRLMRVFGHYLISYQTAPLCYLVLIVCFLFLAGACYRRHQVRG